MHIEPQHSEHESSTLPNGVTTNGVVAEDLRALIAVESFGEGFALMRALELDQYALDFRMVFHQEHLVSALVAEAWDVVVCSADTALFDAHAMLALAQSAILENNSPSALANPTHLPTLFYILTDEPLEVEETVDFIRMGATEVLKHLHTDRLRSSIRRERALRKDAVIKPQTTLVQDDDKKHGDDERFRLLVQHSRDVFSMLDENFAIIYQSPSFYRLFEYDPSEILQHHALDFVHPNDQELIATALQKVVVASEAQATATFRVRNAFGVYRTMEGIATNHLHNPGIAAIIVNSRDISERSGMEGALRDSEHQYRALVENLSEGIIITDSDDQCLFANPAAENGFGVERGQLVGRFIREFVKPEMLPVIEVQNAERRDGKSGRYELEIIRPNGSKRWIAINAAPRFDNNGVFTGAFVIINDVTERKNNEEANVLFSQFLERRINERTEALKRANAELKHEIAERRRMEEMLLQSGERLNSLLRNSSDVITIVEESGEISYESPASEKVFGFELFQRIGKNFLDRVHPSNQEAVRAFLHDVIHQPNAVGTIEFLHQSNIKNDYEWIEVTASNQLHNAAVGGIVLNSRDIAARKVAEQELKKALQQEKELNDLKSRFITMVSHEFRTPLTVINSSAEILHLGIGKMPSDKQAMHLERMMASTSRIEQMLNDVLVLARGEAGKTRAVFAPLALEPFCEEIITELTSASGAERRISMTFHTTVAAHPALDEKLMRSIITNLLSNALKYSHDSVRLVMDCSPETIIIQVADKGIGIPDEDQKHMFEAFHRAQNAINIKGTGIGMSIVKYAVDAHEGSIGFASAENEGTTFTVKLPFRTQVSESAIDRS